MSIIVSFNGGGLTINFENVSQIVDDHDYITLSGASIHIVVNHIAICSLSSLIIKKSWLFLADEVYLDTRIDEVENDQGKH